MKSFRPSLLKLCAVLALGLMLPAGCDSGPPTLPPPEVEPDMGPNVPGSDYTIPIPDKYRLTIIGPTSYTLTPGQQATLKVGYMKNEENLPSKAITFTIKGDAKDTTFTTFTAITDPLGVAQTTLLAGKLPTGFIVEASAPQADSVNWSIAIEAPPVPAPKLAGIFTLTSSFDIQTNFAGTKVADVLNVLNEMSNDPEDPGKYIVDLTFAQAFKSVDPTVQQILNAFKPVLYTQVTNLLNSIAPKLVAEVKQIASSISAVARKFQMKSSLISATEQATDQPMVVSHKLESLTWTLTNGKSGTYTFNQLGLTSPEVSAVQLALNGTALSISEHTFPLKFGSFLLVAINQLIIPYINPAASSFTGLLEGWVDCVKVGQQINTTVGLLGEAFWKSACDAALKGVGAFIENQITQINVDSSSLQVSGTCQITDQNNDVYLDTMSNGLWTGTFVLGGSSAAILGPTNNFVGTRTY